jgi:hypothetical protein
VISLSFFRQLHIFAVFCLSSDETLPWQIRIHAVDIVPKDSAYILLVGAMHLENDEHGSLRAGECFLLTIFGTTPRLAVSMFWLASPEVV